MTELGAPSDEPGAPACSRHPKRSRSVNTWTTVSEESDVLQHWRQIDHRLANTRAMAPSRRGFGAAAARAGGLVRAQATRVRAARARRRRAPAARGPRRGEHGALRGRIELELSKDTPRDPAPATGAPSSPCCDGAGTFDRVDQSFTFVFDTFDGIVCKIGKIARIIDAIDRSRNSQLVSERFDGNGAWR